MQLATTDVQDYTLPQLMSLFQLRPGFSEEQLQLSRQQLVREIPMSHQTSMTRPHEIALFVDCACNRIRDESKSKADSKQGTWEQKANPLVQGTGSQVVQERATVAAGRSAAIVSGRRGDDGGVPPGWLNPIGVKTIDIAMNIDSRFRDNYADTTSSDWTLELPVTQYKVASMRIASLEMPLSYYAVEMGKGNSTMLVRWAANTVAGAPPGLSLGALPAAPPAGHPLYDLRNPANPIPVGSWPTPAQGLNAGEAIAWLVVLPDGNYEMGWQGETNAEDIVKGMQSALEAAIPGIYECSSGRFSAFFTYEEWLTVSDIVWSRYRLTNYLAFEVQRASGRGVFASPQEEVGPPVAYAPKPSAIVAIDFAIDKGGYRDLATNLQLKLGWSLGFRVGSYYSPFNNAQQPGQQATERVFSFISESVCNIPGPKYMYLCIDDGNNNHGSSLVGCFAKSTFNKNIMLRVNLVAQGAYTFSWMAFAGLAGSWWRSRDYFGPVTISKLSFKLYDEYGRIINLNGMDWSMAVVFESVYD